MSDVYLTLLSDPTSEYAQNVGNHFKVRLSKSLVLPGQGWQVSIATAILPKMSLLKDLQSSSINLFEIWQDIDKTQYASYS